MRRGTWKEKYLQNSGKIANKNPKKSTQTLLQQKPRIYIHLISRGSMTYIACGDIATVAKQVLDSVGIPSPSRKVKC
jgi:hypothetical protein